MERLVALGIRSLGFLFFCLLFFTDRAANAVFHMINFFPSSLLICTCKVIAYQHIMLSRFNLIRIDAFYIFKLTSHSMLILKTQYILPIKAAHSTDLV